MVWYGMLPNYRVFLGDDLGRPLDSQVLDIGLDTCVRPWLYHLLLDTENVIFSVGHTHMSQVIRLSITSAYCTLMTVLQVVSISNKQSLASIRLGPTKNKSK